MQKHPACAAIVAQRIVAVIRAPDEVSAVAIGRALFAGGLRGVEVSLTTPDAEAAIETLAAERPTGGYVGAGTVLTADDVRRVAAAGATFVVSPITNDDALREAARRGLATIPAAATPTEIVHARLAGADLVKLFPASLWTPRAMRDVLAALPDAELVPTGGISLTTAAEWITAGATAVGVGGNLTGGRPGEITDRAAALLAELTAVRHRVASSGGHRGGSL